ncbi:hypothetical protein KIMH_01940 [Bombiscardovia apis]|uniref:Beta-carotene 15,15'-monooxygenase n=1 Tax=Bombiscardovia apis TaxID=2932182 RepID=A0ABN6SEM3_9BIFI|nr:DUF6020 family protein [Bombiscardovia apis]BDR54083.1 hypothetical protein KIMH_01940 [Bombiscardovia apis]
MKNGQETLPASAEQASNSRPSPTTRWGGRALGHGIAWVLTVLACAWVGLCTAVGPIYRANDTIAHFGALNWLLGLVTFGITLAIVYLAAAWTKKLGKGNTARGRVNIGARTASAIRSRSQNLGDRCQVRAAASPRWRRAGRIIMRYTRSWQSIMVVLLLGWFWVWATLLASFGADVLSQGSEVASWLDSLNGVQLPYRDGSTIMDVYPTAHYLWPAQPTYLTDQHNLPLTLLYGSVMALSRQLTGAADLGLIVLAGAQLVFAAFCAAATANRFFQPAQVFTCAQKPASQPALPSAGPLARALTLAVLLASPLSFLSTIALTKSPLFAWACLWWLGIGYEFHLARRRGLTMALRHRWALLFSSVIMLASAKYAVYLVAVQLLLALAADRKHWKTYLLCLLLPLVAYEGTLGLLVGSGAVIKGDPIEGKSMQLQQIARVAQRNPAGIPQSARENLAPILDLDAAAEAYNPNDADRVKSSGTGDKLTVYRWRTVTANDMKQLNRAWLQIGLRNPTLYVDAFLAESYGYFDLGDSAYVPVSYYVDNGNVQDKSAWIRYWCHDWRGFVGWFARAWAAVPVIGWPAKGNFWVVATLLLLASEALRGRWRDLLYQAPLLLIMGVMVMSPANNFERHILPLVFAFPFLILAFHRQTRLEESESSAQ